MGSHASSSSRGRELVVLAAGYSLGKLALETEPLDQIELSLEPGLALAVLAQGKDGQRVDSGVHVKLAWNRTPFQGAQPGEKAYPDAQYAFERLRTRGLQVHSSGWNNLTPGMPGRRFMKLPAEGPLVIPCLEMGASSS